MSNVQRSQPPKNVTDCLSVRSNWDASVALNAYRKYATGPDSITGVRTGSMRLEKSGWISRRNELRNQVRMLRR
jgi:hypothetical protein